MGREIRQALAPEIRERLEVVLRHEREEFFAHRLHAFVAGLHHAGADLHRIRAEQDELGGVAAALDPAEAREAAVGKLAADELGNLHHHAERDRFHRARRVAAGRRVALDRRLGAKGVEIHAHHAADRIDRADTGRAAAQRGARRILDVRDVGRHLCPEGFFRGAFHPAADFFEDLGVLAHRGAHLAFGQAVRAGEVELESVDAGVLAALDDLDPGFLAILLHDRRNEDAVGVEVLALLELVDPEVKRPVADQLDVFPADDLAAGGVELGVARGNVDDLGGVEADGLRDDGAPALAERAADDAEVGAGRAGADDERIRELEAVDGGGERGHGGGGAGGAEQEPCERETAERGKGAGAGGRTNCRIEGGAAAATFQAANGRAL